MGLKSSPGDCKTRPGLRIVAVSVQQRPSPTGLSFEVAALRQFW